MTQHHQPQSFETLASPSVSFNSEEILISEANNSNLFEDEGNINSLGQKVDQLQRQIENLTKIQTSQDERYRKARQENEALLGRIHGLEDQIRDLEITSEIRAKEEGKRFKDALAKQLKMQSRECEQHLQTIVSLQQETSELKNDLIKSENLCKTLKSEKEALELQLDEKHSELISLDEEIHKLKLVIKNLKQEESVKSNLINILHEELEDSQNRSQRNEQSQYSNHNNSDSDQIRSLSQGSASNKFRSSSPRDSITSSITEDHFSTIESSGGTFNSRTIKDFNGLEISVSKLREENSRLKEVNEELQAQVLNFQLDEGRSLIQQGNKSYSLADELGDIDVQKLMSALKEEQNDNARLRKYMDEILLKIVEKNPEILDKTTPSSQRNQSNKNGLSNDVTTKSSASSNVT